jgi:predicted aminopeptidase
MRRALRWAALCGLLPLLGGCATMGYYWQSVSGHLSLMQAARPIEQWLQDTRTAEPLKDKLRLAGRIRAFAAHQLHLPDNASYLSYADLGRPAVVWNVVAAPEWSLKPEQWCFPVAGCVSYKGYFDEAAAQREAQRIAALGLETTVQPVPAYSTLGWLNWAGGDPLLSTFIGYPEGELARLIFHELAHQVVYVAGDTAFNESFATAVERLGAQLWLEQASASAREQYAALDVRRRQWRELALQLRRDLMALYAAAEPPGPQQRQAKQELMHNFALQYARLRSSWGNWPGYDRWVARVNNASLAVLAEYEDLAPAFERLYWQQGSWPAFYDEVRRLAQLPRPQRHQQLRQLLGP